MKSLQLIATINLFLTESPVIALNMKKYENKNNVCDLSFNLLNSNYYQHSIILEY